MSQANSVELFETSWANTLVENTIGALLIPIVVALALVFFRGVESWPVALGVGGITAVIAFTFYSWRFFRRGAQRVEIDAKRIVVQGRRGDTQSLGWEESGPAKHGSSYGLHWQLGGNASAPRLVLRDDGFSTAQWDAICIAIRRQLKPHGVVPTSDGLAAAFDDDEVDSPGAGSRDAT